MPKARILLNISNENSAMWESQKRNRWAMVCDINPPQIYFYDRPEQLQKYANKLIDLIRKKEQQNLTKDVYVYLNTHPLLMALIFKSLAHLSNFTYPYHIHDEWQWIKLKSFTILEEEENEDIICAQ